MVIDIRPVLLIKIEQDLREVINSGDDRDEIEKKIRMQLSVYKRILNADIISELEELG